MTQPRHGNNLAYHFCKKVCAGHRIETCYKEDYKKQQIHSKIIWKIFSLKNHLLYYELKFTFCFHDQIFGFLAQLKTKLSLTNSWDSQDDDWPHLVPRSMYSEGYRTETPAHQQGHLSLGIHFCGAVFTTLHLTIQDLVSLTVQVMAHVSRNKTHID